MYLLLRVIKQVLSPVYCRITAVEIQPPLCRLPHRRNVSAAIVLHGRTVFHPPFHFHLGSLDAYMSNVHTVACHSAAKTNTSNICLRFISAFQVMDRYLGLFHNVFNQRCCYLFIFCSGFKRI